MKPRCSNQRNQALTIFEAIIVVAVLALLVAMLLPTLSGHGHRQRINCVNNLKQVGLAYRIWSGDNNDRYPMEVSVTNGGTLELNNGRNAWINYLVMSNELSTPKILLCPDDIEHSPAATNFSWQLSGHVSYFVGLDARETIPQTWLSGDDNFAVGNESVEAGLLKLTTNMPITWTASRHHFAGNLCLADGSVQSVSCSGLTNSLRQTGLTTNRLAIP